MEEFDDPTLQDPDQEREGKYSWDEEFQRHIAALLMADRQFVLQSLDLVKPGYFTNKAHAKVVSICFEFFTKYRLMPRKEFILQEIKSHLKENKALPYYLAEVNVLFDYFQPGLEARDYLQDKITYFAKIQSVKQAFKKSLELIDKNPESEETWDKIYAQMRDSMTVHQNFDKGIDYFKSIKDRYAAMGEESDLDRYITGCPTFDNAIKGGGFSKGESFSIVAGSGVGKCFGRGTLVLMFDGSFKRVENIVVGDLVMGDDSTPRRVLRTHRGVDQLYKVVPVKGNPYVVNSEHTLVLKRTSNRVDAKSGCRRPRYENSPWRNGELFELSVKDYLRQSPRFRNNMRGFRVGVDFAERPVRVNPYFLGVWLGDGTSRCVDITNADPEVNEAVACEAASRDLAVNIKSLKGNAANVSVTNRVGTNSLRKDLKHYNLLKNKHVPDDYKVNSREVRLQVLAGLFDTDGSKSNNCFDFVNKNKQLADDVVFLARSLGLAAYVKPCHKTCQTGGGGIYWRVTISGDTSEIPVRIGRKVCHARKQAKRVNVTGIKVVPAGCGQYFGFETDGNHRFLLADFTVVHNSVFLACMTSTNLLRGKRGVYISTELKAEKIAERLDAIMTGFPIQNLYPHRDKIYEKLIALDGVTLEGETWPLLIKHFPPGTLSVNKFRAYIAQLKFQDFAPDFVVVDYIGLMQDLPDMKVHESREKIVTELTGIADEEEFFLGTAMQPNRDFKKDAKGENARIDDHHLADAYGQVRPLFGCLSMMQNDTEKLLGIGRAYVIKLRDGTSRFQFYLRFDKECLKITEITREEYLSILNSHKEYVSDETKVDMIVEKWKPKEEKEPLAAFSEVAKESVDEDEGSTT